MLNNYKGYKGNVPAGGGARGGAANKVPPKAASELQAISLLSECKWQLPYKAHTHTHTSARHTHTCQAHSQSLTHLPLQNVTEFRCRVASTVVHFVAVVVAVVESF